MATGTAERTRDLSENAERARKAALRLGDSDLGQWAEALTMDLQKHVTSFMGNGNVAHLYEATVIAESIPGVLAEQIERANRPY